MWTLIFKSILMILSLIAMIYVGFIMLMLVSYVCGVILSSVGLTGFGDRLKLFSKNQLLRIKNSFKLKSKASENSEKEGQK